MYSRQTFMPCYRFRGKKQMLLFKFLASICCLVLVLLFVIEISISKKAFKENLNLHIILENKTAQLMTLQQTDLQQSIAASFGMTNKLNVSLTHGSTKRKSPEKRLVHLDLKGAPPKMSYLLEILPLLKSLGATGLLIEYEDMFPYHGSLKLLRSKNAYSSLPLRNFLQYAASLSLEIVPLLPTFGHLEFVLKHKKYLHLREVSKYQNVPCPLHQDTLKLVQEMVNQILEFHSNINYVHIGGDEVYPMKECGSCKKSSKSKSELYLEYMTILFKHINRKTKSHVRPIIWDDMIRSWSDQDMRKIADSTDIMVWGYVPNLKDYSLFPKGMWDKYNKVFTDIWIATSFKGSRVPNNNLVPISMHVRNHESWLKQLEKININIIGVTLTGWARFDHFGSLCELLPASLPCLGICLHVLKEGSFSNRLKHFVGSILGFVKSDIMIEKDYFSSWDTTIPLFPGGDVYSLVAELQNFISWFESAKIRCDTWLNNRQLQNDEVGMLQVDGVKNTLNMLIPSMKSFREKCKTVLMKYFVNVTVDEWIEDKVDVYINLAYQLDRRVKSFNMTEFHS